MIKVSGRRFGPGRHGVRMPNEADTGRQYVVPKLQAAGWDTEPHRLNEQVTFTDGRIVVTGSRTRCRPANRADHLPCDGPDVRQAWADAQRRSDIIGKVAERGIDFDELAGAANQADADQFNLLCHVAFNAPLRTRRERAQRLRTERKDFFDQYGPEARAVLSELLDKYTEHGTAQFVIPDALELPPINRHGNVIEIARRFGGEATLVEAVSELQRLLYAA